VLIDGDRALEVRAREDTQALFALEKRLADAQAR
jgi:hypothetical protein